MECNLPQLADQFGVPVATLRTAVRTYSSLFGQPTSFRSAGGVGRPTALYEVSKFTEAWRRYKEEMYSRTSRKRQYRDIVPIAGYDPKGPW